MRIVSGVDGFSKTIVPMTLEGCVVRISDIIGYIGRDIEDAITLKVIKRRDIPERVKKVLGSSNDKIIDTLVMDLIKNSYGKKYLTLSGDVYSALDELFTFNRDHIYTNPAINTELPKIKNIYTQLFERYCTDLENDVPNSGIHFFVSDMDKSYIRDTKQTRIVIDFIAGMTDDFFDDQYQELFVPKNYGYCL